MSLYERLKANLLTSAKLAADETLVPVLDPGRGKTKTGYFWAIARDDRPWGGANPPAVVYTYAPGRSAEHRKAGVDVQVEIDLARRRMSITPVKAGETANGTTTDTKNDWDSIYDQN